MKPLKINADYLALVPRPSKEEYEALERSIVEHGGCLEPIEINERDEVLDGHTRFKICDEHVLYFDTKLVKLPSVLDEKLYIIEKNLFRRHLTNYQRVEMAQPLEDLIAEKARQRQLLGATLPSNEGKGETTELTAKAIGVSKSSYERAKKIRDEGTEEEKEETRTGKYTISRTYGNLMRRKRMEEDGDRRPVSTVIGSASRREGWTTWASLGTAHLGDKDLSHIAASLNTDNGDWRADFSPDHGHLVDSIYANKMSCNDFFSRTERIKQSLIWNYLYDSPEEDITKFVSKVSPEARERVEYVADHILMLKKENSETMDRKRVFKEKTEELHTKFKQVTVEFTDGATIPLKLRLLWWQDNFNQYKRGSKKWLENTVKHNIIPAIAEEILGFDKNGKYPVSTTDPISDTVDTDLPIHIDIPTEGETT